MSADVTAYGVLGQDLDDRKRRCCIDGVSREFSYVTVRRDKAVAYVKYYKLPEALIVECWCNVLEPPYDDPLAVFFDEPQFGYGVTCLNASMKRFVYKCPPNNEEVYFAGVYKTYEAARKHAERLGAPDAIKQCYWKGFVRS